MLTSSGQERQLDPRYRRILSFGDVLDESIGLFRRRWLTFAMVSAVWLIPPGLIAVLITAAGGFDTRSLATDLQTGVLPTVASVTGLVASLAALTLVSALFVVAWTAAILVTTDDLLHGVTPDLGRVVGRTLSRYLPAFIGGLLYGLTVLVLMLVASLIVALFVIAGAIGLVLTLAAIAALVVWWLKPDWRNPYLKWVIVVCTPFGLPIYVGGLWSMYMPAAVLERRGPVSALGRSSQLVDRQWFRVVTILSLAALIVSTLQYAPTLLVELPLTIGAAVRGQTGLSPAETAISTGASIVFQVLFASMGIIVYALTYLDLRNRREGTDIAERLSQLESLDPSLANG